MDGGFPGCPGWLHVLLLMLQLESADRPAVNSPGSLSSVPFPRSNEEVEWGGASVAGIARNFAVTRAGQVGDEKRPHAVQSGDSTRKLFW